MATVGDVVFQRNQDDDDNDIWDDTALIKAYDSAIKTMKTKLGGVCDTEPVVSDNQEKSSKKHLKKKWKTRKGLAQKQTHQQWNVGDPCEAVFLEDGQIYEAVILSINKPDQTCLVQYVGYGNEEPQALSALLPAASDHEKSNCPLPNDSHAASDNDSMDMSPRDSSRRTTPSPSHFRGRSSQRGTPRLRYPGGRGGHSPFSAWPNPPAMPSFPFTPPMMGAPFSMPSWPGPPTPPRMPQMPPPPPPPMVDEDVMESDSEALYSMLIAWYMSGYHTGYYQGLKQGRKQSKMNKT